jgi:NADP-dependent 3-hydroxy acid dehydrogenase YdfG
MSKLAKTILITGASSGFGRDTAETLTREGHSVFASFRDSAGRNKSHAEALQSKGINVVELDVTNNDSVERAVSNVLSRAGRIDVVINNAGIASAGVSEAFTAEQVRDLFEVNVFGIQRVLRAVLPTLRKQRDGLVINVGSILGRVTFPFFGLYGASKYAVEALTDSYRYEAFSQQSCHQGPFDLPSFRLERISLVRNGKPDFYGTQQPPDRRL